MVVSLQVRAHSKNKFSHDSAFLPSGVEWLGVVDERLRNTGEHNPFHAIELSSDDVHS